ncbi:unnamed protein product [Cylindrotheca closterium]|uniref:Uncharacterized protein n=1 Tax=Cylindrotheca closterium TaxID=2856 RepID=A0AAD2FQS5_9STRA|nr:unnamed protein product [Cylindrotheca closterium]
MTVATHRSAHNTKRLTLPISDASSSIMKNPAAKTPPIHEETECSNSTWETIDIFPTTIEQNQLLEGQRAKKRCIEKESFEKETTTWNISSCDTIDTFPSTIEQQELLDGKCCKKQ